MFKCRNVELSEFRYDRQAFRLAENKCPFCVVTVLDTFLVFMAFKANAEPAVTTRKILVP